MMKTLVRNPHDKQNSEGTTTQNAKHKPPRGYKFLNKHRKIVCQNASLWNATFEFNVLWAFSILSSFTPSHIPSNSGQVPSQMVSACMLLHPLITGLRTRASPHRLYIDSNRQVTTRALTLFSFPHSLSLHLLSFLLSADNVVGPHLDPVHDR